MFAEQKEFVKLVTQFYALRETVKELEAKLREFEQPDEVIRQLEELREEMGRINNRFSKENILKLIPKRRTKKTVTKKNKPTTNS